LVGEAGEAAVEGGDHDAEEVVVEEVGDGKFAQVVSVGGRHVLSSDEPVSQGGTDSGPNPYEFLLAALGSCTSMTLRMYADHKGLALDKVRVSLSHAKVHAKDCADCDSTEGKVDVIERDIAVSGDLDEKTRARLIEIADKCPVHRTLHGEIKVRTRLAD
jgi:putative redox protein